MLLIAWTLLIHNQLVRDGEEEGVGGGDGLVRGPFVLDVAFERHEGSAKERRRWLNQ
jgi:hypothetical protein